MTTPAPDPRVIPLVDHTGRNKMAEATDPYTATAVSLVTPGYDGVAAMARTFVEEFALMGWSRDHLLRMFRNTHLAGPRAVYDERGEAFVRALIDDVLGLPPPGDGPPASAPSGERTERSRSDARPSEPHGSTSPAAAPGAAAAQKGS